MMRLVPLFLAGVLVAAPTVAQQRPAVPAESLMMAEREALAKLAWMDGQWRGEAVTQTQTGPIKVVHTERVGTLLSGTVRLVEGRAYQSDGSTAFNAFGIISYDPATKRYRLTSHAEGRYGEFPLTVTADGYEWSIPAGPGRLKYTAVFKNDVWTEVGMIEMPGQPPRETLRMSVRKIGASSWPQQGAVGAR